MRLIASVATSRDMERMKKAFEDLNKEGGGSSTWSHDSGSDSWGHAKSQLSQVAGKLSAVGERSHHQVSAQWAAGLECMCWCVRRAGMQCSSPGLVMLVKCHWAGVNT